MVYLSISKLNVYCIWHWMVVLNYVNTSNHLIYTNQYLYNQIYSNGYPMLITIRNINKIVYKHYKYTILSQTKFCSYHFWLFLINVPIGLIRYDCISAHSYLSISGSQNWDTTLDRVKRRCYTPFLQQFFAFDLEPKHCCIPFYLKLEWFIIKSWFSCWICIEYWQFDLRRKHCRIRFYTKISESTLNTVVP